MKGEWQIDFLDSTPYAVASVKTNKLTSWTGFSNNFTNPPPWYFRTLETWKELFYHNGFSLSEILEPLNPKTKSFTSIIFIGEITANRKKYTFREWTF